MAENVAEFEKLREQLVQSSVADANDRYAAGGVLINAKHLGVPQEVLDKFSYRPVMPEGLEPKLQAALENCRPYIERSNNTRAVLNTHRIAMAEYLGVGDVFFHHRGAIWHDGVAKPVGKVELRSGGKELELPIEEFTLAGLQKHTGHEVFRNNTIFGKATMAAEAAEHAVPPAENVAAKVEQKVEQAAEGMWAKFAKMHWGGKTAIIGGAAAAVAGAGYWALRETNKNNVTQQQPNGRQV